MALVIRDPTRRPSSRSSSVEVRRKSSWATLLHPRTALKVSRTDPDLSCHDIELASLGETEPWKDLDKYAELGLTLDAEEEENPNQIVEFPRLSTEGDYHAVDAGETTSMVKPFQKWMKTLHRRAQQRSRQRSSTDGQVPFPDLPDDGLSYGHRESSSDSSFGYVAGVRSASISFAGSAFTRSRRNTVISSQRDKADRSSRASMSVGRRSEDSVRSERSVIDPAVTERLLQRRRILEELIHTEESYIGDVKFLMNVYITILASLPTQHPGLRSSINRNLTDIVELHEEILGELHRVVPNSEYTQVEQLYSAPNPARKPSHHQRWRSLDSVPEDDGGGFWLRTVPGMTADPGVAAEVSRIFRERMHRFFVYEEYSAKYEMMIKEVASAPRTMPQWESYQKGLEALAASLGSVHHQLDRSRKSLTIGDLLVKPIQRICKYPLLFAELLKYTPVYDCPNSHSEIENVLARLREATTEINRATGDPSVKVSMETTWLLQDRLVFPNQVKYNCVAPFIFVGRHEVAYKATSKVDQLYTIQACIGLNTIKIEEADNGRGLQCHTAPFSWKLVFEINHQLYEIVMTACTPKEEHEWRSRLANSIPSELQEPGEPLFCSALSMNIKSLGTVFGKPGSVARRLSIHRATTVGPKSPLCQVILKNTTTMRDPSNSASDAPINRSQSLLTTTSRIPILAPPRGERARLEAQLSDVWSRKVLPFPGITTRSRSEHLVRTSASTMMRKLSVASITNSFAKRSGSSPSASTEKANNKDPPQANNVVDSVATVDHEFPTPTLDLDYDLSDFQRLPVIRDATERSNSCSPGMASTEADSPSGTVRRLDLSKSENKINDVKDSDGKASKTMALRTSSANSVPRQPPTKAGPPATPMMEKENMSKAQQVKRSVQETTSPAKPSKRSKVGSINRSVMAGAIRNFFR
ncbi:RhoGEF domain-containing protein [Seiridium cupressi]